MSNMPANEATTTSVPQSGAPQQVQPPPPESPLIQGVEDDHASWALQMDKPHLQIEAAVRRARERDRLQLTARTEQLREMLGHVSANPWLSTGRGLLFALLGVAGTLAVQETGSVQIVAVVGGVVVLLALFALQKGGHPGANRAKAIRNELDGRERH